MKPREFEVHIHLGAENTKFEAQGNTTLAAVKDRGLSDLHIVIDPAFDYLLIYEGIDETNEALTLDQLVGEHDTKEVTFHIKKRPKGG